MRVHRLLIPLLLTVLAVACYRGKPSEDPPVHLNPNMDSQPKYKAQSHSEFFEDGATMRPPAPGTVAQGDLRENDVYYLGKDDRGIPVKKAPVTITMTLLRRGQERFNIYCAPCHDRAGTGQGIITKKGYLPPPSFHIDRLREENDGHFYEVITNGIRNMPAYNYQIPVQDRWAIVAYIRALQRSQNANLSDVPEELRSGLR